MSQADAEEESRLPPEEEAALLAVLEAALRPQKLDWSVNQRLIEMALEDTVAEPSAEELVESARLRDALDGGAPHPDAHLLRALGAPFGAVSRDATASVRALDAALELPFPTQERARSNLVYAIFGGVSALLAAAAAVALVVGSARPSEPSAATAGVYVMPHSTAPLFADRFETGDTTARVDLIASMRRRDLRDNRYAAWGVR